MKNYLFSFSNQTAQTFHDRGFMESMPESNDFSEEIQAADYMSALAIFCKGAGKGVEDFTVQRDEGKEWGAELTSSQMEDLEDEEREV